MIDRLQKAGFVRREADTADRRKVIVKPVMEKIAQFVLFYEKLVKEANQLYSTYTDKELEFLTDYNKKLTAFYEKQITEIREKK